MRGFPLINSAIILIALGLILVPLIRLTSAPSDRMAPAVLLTPASADLENVSVTLRSAHRPDFVAVSHLGKRLIDTKTVDAVFDLELAIPDEGIDLLVEVVWPNGTPETALEVTLEPTARESLARVVWGEERTEEILTFVWE